MPEVWGQNCQGFGITELRFGTNGDDLGEMVEFWVKWLRT